MPSQKMARYETHELGGDQKGTTLRLKKWSVSKLFALIRDFSAIAEELLKDVKDDLNEIAIVSNLVRLIGESETRATRVIRESVAEPELTDEGILDWDADDFLKVLTKIFQMNLTEDLVKNFQSLLGSIFRRKTEPAKKEKR